MIFRLGEKVLFLHEKGFGIITECLPNGNYRVQDEDGFIKTCSNGELCKVHGEEFTIESPIESQKGVAVRKNGNSQKPIPEIDLHIENLLDSTSGMSNHEIVQYQLRMVRLFIEDLKNRKIRKALIIHGVGEGVLRNEVHNLLRGIDGAIFHDEHYTPKGFGATLLELRYNY